MFDFKNYLMKITSKSPSRHLVKLQGKLKLTKTEKNLHIRKFLLHFSKFQCTCHQPISVGYFACSVNHLISSGLQNLCFLNFALRAGGAAAKQLPLGAPMGVISKYKKKVNRF
jgi:hypothetical protein